MYIFYSFTASLWWNMQSFSSRDCGWSWNAAVWNTKLSSLKARSVPPHDSCICSTSQCEGKILHSKVYWGITFIPFCCELEDWMHTFTTCIYIYINCWTSNYGLTTASCIKVNQFKMYTNIVISITFQPFLWDVLIETFFLS